MSADVCFTVIRDSREQAGNGYLFDGRTRGCAGTEVACLKTGDYAIKGLEDILIIERKGDVKEYAANVFQPRFRRELERMRGVPLAYVVLEFPLRDLLDYPRVPCVPHRVRAAIRVTGSALLREHLLLEQEFPSVRFHFAGAGGRGLASSLFKRAVEHAAKLGRKPA